MKEQDFAALLDILKQLNHTLQKGNEQNAEAQKMITEFLKGLAWEKKDGGLSHDLCLALRYGIFGQNADPHSSILELMAAIRERE